MKSLILPASSAHRPRLLRHALFSAASLTALLALAPVTLAAKGAKGGKPGGGGGSPPSTVEYTARQIPAPSGWQSFQMDDINAQGDCAGFLINQSGRNGNLFGPGIFWNRGGNTLHLLSPLALPSHNAAKALGLSDDGKVVFGISFIDSIDTNPTAETPVLWINPGDGAFVPVALAAKLSAFAPSTACAPWGFTSYTFPTSIDGQGTHRGSLITGDARYIVLIGLKSITWGTATNPNVGVVARLDWTNPHDPAITGMWPIGAIPSSQAGTPGYRGEPMSIRSVVENPGTENAQEIVIVSGRYWDYDANGTTTTRQTPMVWELEPATGASAGFPLDQVNGGDPLASFGIAFDVNALGEAVGYSGPVSGTTSGYYWDAVGTPLMTTFPAGSTSDYRLTAINDSGVAVGYSAGLIPIVWNARTPAIAPRNLKPLTEGSVPIEEAVDINASGEILAADWNDSQNRFYLLTRIAP